MLCVNQIQDKTLGGNIYFKEIILQRYHHFFYKREKKKGSTAIIRFYSSNKLVSAINEKDS